MVLTDHFRFEPCQHEGSLTLEDRDGGEQRWAQPKPQDWFGGGGKNDLAICDNGVDLRNDGSKKPRIAIGRRFTCSRVASHQQETRQLSPIPQAIATEAAAVMARTRETADAQMRAGVEQAKADLARAVALAAQDLARDVARRQTTQWLIYGMAVDAALVMTGIAVGRALAP